MKTGWGQGYGGFIGGKNEEVFARVWMKEMRAICRFGWFGVEDVRESGDGI